MDKLPQGSMVGTVEIVGCRPLETGYRMAACFTFTDPSGRYAWLPELPERAENLVKPKNSPSPCFSTHSDHRISARISQITRLSTTLITMHVTIGK